MERIEHARARGTPPFLLTCPDLSSTHTQVTHPIISCTQRPYSCQAAARQAQIFVGAL